MPKFKTLDELIAWIYAANIVGYLGYRSATILGLYQDGVWEDLKQLHETDAQRLVSLRRNLARRAKRPAPDNHETYLLQGVNPSEILALQVADYAVLVGTLLRLGNI